MGPIRDAEMRRAAWFDFLFVDFGILRLLWKNDRWVSPRLLRMNQPYPSDVRRAFKHGVRAVLCARNDPRHGGHALVAETCAQLGLVYAHLPLGSREAPAKDVLMQVPALFASLPTPVLLHCKSGADRAGFVAALWRIVMEGHRVRAARAELTLRHLHIRASRTGILDAVFEAYLADHPQEDVPFMAWVAQAYDAQAITQRFKAKGWADWLDRVVLRHE